MTNTTPLSRITPRTLLVAAVVVAAVLAAGLAATLLVPPGTTPVGLTVADGDSMGSSGQQVVLYADLSPSVGDVVIFDAGAEHGLVRHRIVDATAEGFVTKGDANAMVDQRALSEQLDGMPYASAERVRGVSLVTVPVSLLAGVGAGVVGLVVVVGLWRFRRGVGAGARGFSRRLPVGKGKSVVVALLIVLSLISGFPFGSSFEVVQTASAANVVDDFEDGDLSEWTDGTINSTIVYEGQYSFSADSGASRSFPNTTSVSYWQYAHQQSGTSVINLEDGDTSLTSVYYDPSYGSSSEGKWVHKTGSFDTVATVNNGQWFRVIYDNISFSSNSFDLRIVASNGTTIAKKDNAGFSNSGSRIDGVYASGASNFDYLLSDATTPDGYSVTGRVTGPDGSAISGATVTDSNGNSTTTNATGQYSLALANGTYSLTASKSGYADTTESVTVDGAAVAQDFQLKGSLSGTVRSRAGDPVSNATVVAVAYNESAYSGTIDQIQDKIAKNQQEVSDPLPETWDDYADVSNLRENITEQAAGTTTSNLYPVAHYKDDWFQGDAYVPLVIRPTDVRVLEFDQDPVLNTPRAKFSPDDAIVLSCWDRSGAGNLVFRDNVDGDLPGKTASCNMTLERLTPSDEVESKLTVQPQEIYDPTIGNPASAAIIPGDNLAPGVYRLTAKDPDAGIENSYPIVVAGDRDPGSLARSIRTNATDINGELTDRVETLRDLQVQNKVRVVRTTADENGEWSAKLNTTLYTSAQITAYRAPVQMPGDPRNITQQDVIEYYEAEIETARDDFQQQVESGDVSDAQTALGDLACGEDSVTGIGNAYVPAGTTKAKNPGANIDVVTYRVGVPEELDVRDTLCSKAALLDYLNTHGLEGLIPTIFEDLQGKSDAFVEETFAKVRQGMEQNADICRQVLQQRGVEDLTDCTLNDGAPGTGGDGYLGEPGTGVPTSPDAVEDTTRETIEIIIDQGQEAQDTVRDTVETGDPSNTVGDGTVGATFPFPSDLEPDQFLIYAEYSNGTTRVLNESSEYVTLDNGLPGGGSEIRVEDYPLSDGDAAQVNFRAEFFTPQGTGSSATSVTNPTFPGQVPKLSSIRVSQLTPTTGDRVELSTRAPASSSFGQLDELRVRYPDGTDRTISDVTTGDTAGFTANQSGDYRVRAVFSPTDSDEQFVETVVVSASETGVTRPSMVKTQSGPTGRYAIVTDAFRDGSYEVGRGGAQATVTGVFKQDTVPNEAEIHMESVDLAPTSTTTIRLLEGESESAVRTRLPVRVYMGTASEDALVYRGANVPVTEEQRTAGRVYRENGSLVFSGTTAPDGSLNLKVINDPSRIDKIVFDFRTLLGGIDIPFVGFVSVADLTGVATSLSTLLGGLVWGRRRWAA